LTVAWANKIDSMLDLNERAFCPCFERHCLSQPLEASADC
jgi:hypothetical protein